MCGRYYIREEDSASDLQEIIDQLNRKGQTVKTGEIFPSDTVPVIANSKSMQPSPFAMPWGFTIPDGKLIINARSETAAEKPMFRDGMQQRRCLLPASHYFEWEKRQREKIKYAIKPSGSDMLFMAGLYRIEGNKARFTILTRTPADNISFIHDRMPVILPKEAMNDWLNPRYAADDVIRAAVTDVQYAPIQTSQQISLLSD